jgi:hypothetical protein
MKILAALFSLLALVLFSAPVHAQASAAASSGGASASASVSAPAQPAFAIQPQFAPQFQSFAAPVFAVPQFQSFSIIGGCGAVQQPAFIGVNRFASINVGGFNGGFGGSRVIVAVNGGGRSRTNIRINQRIR